MHRWCDDFFPGDRRYVQTKRASSATSSKLQRDAYLAAWRKANANDRRDLYTDNWEGDEYKGSAINTLSVLAAISILTPLIGLIFAYFSYGRLWG